MQGIWYSMQLCSAGLLQDVLPLEACFLSHLRQVATVNRLLHPTSAEMLFSPNSACTEGFLRSE